VGPLSPPIEGKEETTQNPDQRGQGEADERGLAGRVTCQLFCRQKHGRVSSDGTLGLCR
jgi:hypothetical protein